LFGAAFGFIVISAANFYAISDMSVIADDIGIISPRHGRLLRALQPGRLQPIVHMRRRLSLTRTAQKQLACSAADWLLVGGPPEAFSLFC
jgi:hypothetical protein